MRGSKSTAAGLLWAALALAGFALGALPAAAQDDDVERTALARSLFRQGVELSDAGRWAEAADYFRRSLSLRDSPIVEFNLGTALTHTGRLVEATELFRRAARESDAPERLRSAARQQVEALAPRLGRLTVTVEGPLETVELRLDGDVLPAEGVGVPAPADPGHHVLVAMRGEAEVARAEVDLTEGGSQEVRLEVPPPPVVVTPPPDAHAAVVLVERGHTREEADRRGGTPVTPGGSDDALVWLGVILGVVVAGGAAALTTVLVLDAQGTEPPIEGNLLPAVIVFE